jgi:transposase
MDKTICGIDVSKDRLDVAVRPSGERFVVARTGAGLDELVARLKVLKPNLVVLEATGGFETVVVAALAGAGLPVAVANPAQIRAFAKAIGQRAKTDPIDAEVIAHFGEATGITARPLPDQATQQLADLVARRRQIVDMIGAEGQREKRANSRIRKSIGRLVKALERELSSVDSETDDAVRGSPAWREKEDLLSSVPSIGPVISRTLIAGLPELGSLGRTHRGACRACPLHASIGPVARQELHRRWQDERAQGPVHGRYVARRHNPVLKAFFERLVAAGKPKKVAMVAVARKLLTILNAIVRDGT